MPNCWIWSLIVLGWFDWTIVCIECCITSLDYSSGLYTCWLSWLISLICFLVFLTSIPSYITYSTTPSSLSLTCISIPSGKGQDLFYFSDLSLRRQGLIWNFLEYKKGSKSDLLLFVPLFMISYALYYYYGFVSVFHFLIR